MTGSQRAPSADSSASLVGEHQATRGTTPLSTPVPMRILFIENRYKTLFWEEIARQLEREDGVEVHWIVQNHGYRPQVGHIHTIPYPHDKSELPGDRAPDSVARMDRQRTYYGYSSWHYGHYWRHIGAIFDEINPD